MSGTKNLTISLSLEEYATLEKLIEYFQKQSISTVTRSDVIKFLIYQMNLAVEKDMVQEVRRMVEEE